MTEHPSYQPIYRLGAGGLTEAWLAGRVGPKGKLQALGLVKRFDADTLERARLTHRLGADLQRLAGQRWDGVAPVFELRTHEAGLEATVGLVFGENLRRLLAHGALTAGPAIRLISRAAFLLHPLHSGAMAETLPAHGALSPHALYVDLEGDLQIADYGLVRLVDGLAATLPDRLLARAAYLAPEIWRGDPIDARADVFSLGAILWEALIGAPPFQGERVDQIRHAVLEEPRPSALGARPWIGPELAELLDRCLDADPAGRPLSCDSLHHSLESILAGLDEPSDLAHIAGLLQRRLPQRVALWRALEGDLKAGRLDLEAATQGLAWMQDLANDQPLGPQHDPTEAHVPLEGHALIEARAQLFGASPQARPERPSRFAPEPAPSLELDLPAEPAQPSPAAPGARSLGPGVVGWEGAPQAPRRRWPWLIAPAALLAALAALYLYGPGAPGLGPEGLSLEEAEEKIREGRAELAALAKELKPADDPAAPLVALDTRPPPERPVAPGVASVIVIDSQPPGATIELGGIALGETPLAKQQLLPEPPFEVVLRLPGYRPFRKRYETRPGELHLNPRLRRRPPKKKR